MVSGGGGEIGFQQRRCTMDILIVEDDELQRKVLYDHLKKSGHAVKAANDGE